MSEIEACAWCGEEPECNDDDVWLVSHSCDRQHVCEVSVEDTWNPLQRRIRAAIEECEREAWEAGGHYGARGYQQKELTEEEAFNAWKEEK